MDYASDLVDPGYMKKAITIIIDSRDRNYATHPKEGEYVVDLPREYHNVTAARLVAAEVPNSFFVFTAAKGNTTIRVNDTDVTIPDGNYTFTSISSALATALNVTMSPQVFTVSIDRTTLKCTISCTSDPADELSIDTTTAPAGQYADWGLAYYLGFARGVVRSGFGSVTSPTVVVLNPVLFLMLDIQELNAMDECGIYNSGARERAFAYIPVNVNSYDYIHQDRILGMNTLCPPIRKLTKLHIKWRFHGNEVVDFGGIEHSFVIEVVCTERRGSD